MFVCESCKIKSSGHNVNEKSSENKEIAKQINAFI